MYIEDVYKNTQWILRDVLNRMVYFLTCMLFIHDRDFLGERMSFVTSFVTVYFLLIDFYYYRFDIYFMKRIDTYL